MLNPVRLFDTCREVSSGWGVNPKALFVGVLLGLLLWALYARRTRSRQLPAAAAVQSIGCTLQVRASRRRRPSWAAGQAGEQVISSLVAGRAAVQARWKELAILHATCAARRWPEGSRQTGCAHARCACVRRLRHANHFRPRQSGFQPSLKVARCSGWPG